MTDDKEPAHKWAFLLALVLAALAYLIAFPFVGHLALLLFLAVYVGAAGGLFRYVERH